MKVSVFSAAAGLKAASLIGKETMQLQEKENFSPPFGARTFTVLRKSFSKQSK
jgi:hypothetical protein